MSIEHDQSTRKQMRAGITGENVLRPLDEFSVEVRAVLNAKQAKIDSLMLEYCPEEMTEEQASEWASHQVRAVCANNPNKQ